MLTGIFCCVCESQRVFQRTNPSANSNFPSLLMKWSLSGHLRISVTIAAASEHRSRRMPPHEK